MVIALGFLLECRPAGHNPRNGLNRAVCDTSLTAEKAFLYWPDGLAEAEKKGAANDGWRARHKAYTSIVSPP